MNYNIRWLPVQCCSVLISILCDELEEVSYIEFVKYNTLVMFILVTFIYCNTVQWLNVTTQGAAVAQ